jgi:hypothetical protein
VARYRADAAADGPAGSRPAVREETLLMKARQ